jgi:DNA-binding MarR family transcriptional regulator
MSAPYTADDISLMTRRLDVVTARLLVAFAREVGVSVSELLALEHLDAGGGAGPSDLAHRLQMSTGSVTALLDRLEASGHAVRAPHPSDRRRVVVSRTAKADEVLAREAAPVAAQVRELAASLSAQEREVVGCFLERFLALLEKSADEACAA